MNPAFAPADGVCAAWRTVAAIVLGIAFAGTVVGRAAEVRGVHENPNADFGRGAPFQLAGDTEFGWRTGTLDGDLDLNGYAFVLDTGGGNHTVFRGVIRGRGTFEWRGGGVPQVAPSVLTGPGSNTFTGTFTLAKGVVDPDKPESVDAIPGPLVLWARGPAVVRWAKPHQSRDDAPVTLAGPGECRLELRGYDERIGSLALATHGVIDLGKGPVFKFPPPLIP